MIALTQITNTEIFAFIVVLVFKLLRLKVSLINKKDNRNCEKVGYLLRLLFRLHFFSWCKIINNWNAKFSGSLKVSDHLSVLFHFA